MDYTRITRREFLKWTGVFWSGLLLTGCGQQPGALAPTPSPATPSPSITVAAAAPSAAPATGSADMILVNGKVITVDRANTLAQAVAVKNGLIQSVGASDAIRALAGQATKVVDLKGKTLTPGLIDSHNHLHVMGLTNSYFLPFIPPEVKTLQDLQKKLAEIAAKTPPGEWIKGYYLTVGQGVIPKRQDLDAASLNHPIWLMQQGGHFGAANSVALRIAGITASTPDPVGGIVERDARGEPTGVFYNHRAMDLLRRYIPRYTPEMVRENIATPQPLLAACGVTSFHDNNVRDPDVVAAYLDAGKQGKTILRGVIYFTLEYPQDLTRALQEVERQPDTFMRFAGYKFLIDGQAPTAYCHQAHNGTRWNMPTWEPTSFKRAVRALHDTGLQICVHCIGDAAVDLALDAYEEALKANPRAEPRHRIEHAILTTPTATKRMKDLGVVVGAQPQFIRLGGDVWVNLFGVERARRAVVTREWLEAGVPVALGSDAPTTPWYTPQMTLWGAVHRRTVSDRVLGSDQRLTIQEALRAHTLSAAYAAHEEKVKGSIEPGKLADLAVWGEDPYTASPERLWQIPMTLTIIGGRIVYQA